MTPQEAISFFGTQEKTAQALGITQGAVGGWVISGYIPWARQFHIEVASKGALKADPKDPNPKGGRTSAEPAAA